MVSLVAFQRRRNVLNRKNFELFCFVANELNDYPPSTPGFRVIHRSPMNGFARAYDCPKDRGRKNDRGYQGAGGK